MVVEPSIISDTQRDLSVTGSQSVNEDRILNKLDAIDARSIETLVAVTKLQEQVKDVPELKSRVTALERWRWMAVGALGAAGTSLGAQIVSAMKAGG